MKRHLDTSHTTTEQFQTPQLMTIRTLDQIRSIANRPLFGALFMIHLPPQPWCYFSTQFLHASGFSCITHYKRLSAYALQQTNLTIILNPCWYNEELVRNKVPPVFTWQAKSSSSQKMAKMHFTIVTSTFTMTVPIATNSYSQHLAQENCSSQRWKTSSTKFLYLHIWQ